VNQISLQPLVDGQNGGINFTVHTFETLDSTNTEALKQARLGAGEGLCVLAREQTAGRGRYGRDWISAKDSGLYLSVVLRPKLELRFFPLITLMTGVAVHDMLADIGIESDIKWVNDVHVGGKKICGILAETTETPNGVAVVVGIGINLNSDSFPPYLSASSTSIAAETGKELKRDEIVSSLNRYLDRFYSILTGEDGPARIIRHWRKRSSYFSGKKVRVVLEKETIFGVTEGLEDNGALRVRQSDGTLFVIQAGDVEQIRPAD
jgi:BirA family transcriptional regulator, biotin operon repressor / biotin---[acetyl-CoA-carboxylase] ligase